MKIRIAQAGRRFNKEWIFRNFDYEFESKQSYAILGINGSGKSTLLQVIAGSLTLSEGKIYYLDGIDKPIEDDQIYKYLSFAAPYLNLIEEFTLQEIIEFHFKFKINLLSSYNEIIDLLDMKKNQYKTLKNFSSGMKQRVKLALAFCTHTPILLLDEPTSNLDEQGINWYLKMIDNYSKNRLTIICSNQLHEYSFCDKKIQLIDYK